MNIEIVEHNGVTLRCGNSGGFVVENLSNHPKHYGRLPNAMSMIGWVAIREKLEEIREHYYGVTKPMGPIRLSYEGLPGIQVSENIVKSQCVELVMNYTMVSHLAKSDTGKNKCFPGNQGQALALMIEQDIEDYALKNGPFTDEAELQRFIEDRLVLVEASIAGAERIAGYQGLDEDEPDSDEEAQMEEEAA